MLYSILLHIKDIKEKLNDYIETNRLCLSSVSNSALQKAAEVSFVSPSTLSNAITEMEKHLGFKVFERDNKKVFVTALGAAFLKKAQSIQLQIFDIQKLVANQSDPLSSNLSIGIIPTVSPYFLPIVLPKIKKAYPNLTLRIEESQSNVLVNKVKNGELNMAILALPYNLEGLTSLKFWKKISTG